MKTKKAINLIIEERERQIYQHKWTKKHDDEHDFAELGHAAAAYVLIAGEISVHGNQNVALSNIPSIWPWEEKWWKPSEDPIRNLVKAGALIVAEIERLQRLGLL
jgi:hypothetical protein